MKNKLSQNPRNNNFCYLCRKAKPRFYFKKLGYSIYKCPLCQFLSLDFEQNYQSFIHSYYTKEYFTGHTKIRAYANYKKDKPNILKNAKNILLKVKKVKKEGFLLDVGCAMGFFMEEAEKIGFQAYGVEVSQYAGKIAQKTFGEKIFLGSIENFCQKWPTLPVFKNLAFDVILFSDIIEHLKDPKNVLIKLKQLLKREGLIVIQTGDADSFWARLMKKNWHFFAPPQHLYFFSQKTLAEMLNQTGYQITNIYKEGKYVSVSYIFHMLQYMNIKKIGDYLSQKVSRNAIGRISILVKLFDNMVVFAKPKES